MPTAFVGKQRLEKDMMAVPPGLSTRCISLNTWGGGVGSGLVVVVVGGGGQEGNAWQGQMYQANEHHMVHML